ncbi:MAG: CRISPR-associated endonuclease Cas1 [Candidatus Bathyarchaeia archaeon]
MGNAVKVVNLRLDSFGSFLGMEKGCIILRDKNGKVEKYPLFEAEIGEVVLQSGNLVSTRALSALVFWGIDVVITTRNGRPIAVLKNLMDDAHVKTRINQYEAIKNGKGIYTAKQIVLAKILGQNQVLRKYGLRQHDVMGIKEAISRLDGDLNTVRKRLMVIEAKASKFYFQQIFLLFPKELRPQKRRTFLAYDAVNNLFNLAYELLFYKCYRALTKAHLETHLGFVHNLQFGKPSLVCDFVELYRYLVDDFLIGYVQKLKPKHFKAETVMFNDKKGKRIFLEKSKTDELTNALHEYFRKKVDIPRIKHGFKQEIESLINEEALLLAKFLRNEKGDWIPRVVGLCD